ncbi:MAG: HAMP domain-containing histidine kinase [Lachnospiraceae bacterium]|nr:HAMP domain-containing histidine kinase [Lachnospiraceae bacterium]
MKNYHKAVAVAALLMALGIAALIFFTGKGSSYLWEDDNSTVLLNELCREAEANWGDLSGMKLPAQDISYVILDNSNMVLQSSGHGSDTEKLSVETAVRKCYPYRYVICSGDIVGSVILTDGSCYRQQWNILITVSLVTAFLFLAGMIVYGVYIRKRIIRPFRDLQEFSGRIAEGNLDIPLAMDKDNMFGVFTESFDVMREELIRSRERELALQKKERELVASLSHDLKTPVTGIKLTGELLMARCETGEIDTADFSAKVGNICKKAEQIDALVSDLFSSTLDDLGEFKVNCRDESAQVIDGIITKYDDRGLVVRSGIPEVLVCIDVKSLSRVIGNIISNSYKYAGTAIETRYTVKEGFLEMRISDHGPGVPTDELELITNKFYRGRDWKEGRSEGSGLGLYIAKMLMEKMNGELQAESSGKGLCIILMIPLS